MMCPRMLRELSRETLIRLLTKKKKHSGVMKRLIASASTYAKAEAQKCSAYCIIAN